MTGVWTLPLDDERTAYLRELVGYDLQDQNNLIESYRRLGNADLRDTLLARAQAKVELTEAIMRDLEE